ncbi:MAG: hypothetical protein WDW38_004378 [Sanguina aurantia]
MAPKKVEAASSEDINPYGVFISVTVPSATLKLVLPPPAKASDPPRPFPRTHLSISVPGSVTPALGPPVDCTDGTYAYHTTKHLRRDFGLDTLHTLINNPVLISVVDSVSGLCLATATLDVLAGFALGQGTWSSPGVIELLPAAPLPNSVQCAQGSLASVSIALGHRLPPQEGPDSTAPAAPAVIDPGTPLPDPPLPYSFLSVQEAVEANLLEFSVTGALPIPDGLQAAVDTAGGRMSFSVGLQLPGGSSVVLPGGVLQGGCAVMGTHHATLPAAPGCHGAQVLQSAPHQFPAVLRSASHHAPCRSLEADLTPPQRTEHHLEDKLPLTLELARYLHNEAYSDNAWESHHAMCHLPAASQLLQPGTLAAVGPSTPLAAWAAAPAALQHGASVLPPYVPPAGKCKMLEEVSGSVKPAEGASPWATAGTRLTASLALRRPLLPAWTPPARPSQTLAQLIPARELAPAEEPHSAGDAFKAQIRDAALGLASEFQAASSDDSAPTQESPAAAAAAQAQRTKALVFELNRSGKYLALKEGLKAAVVRLVRERFRKSGAMGPNEMESLYSQLYVLLLDQMHEALSALTDSSPRPPPAPTPSASLLSSLKGLADEQEAVGGGGEGVARAMTLHKRRLVAEKNPVVWFDYATFMIGRRVWRTPADVVAHALVDASGGTPLAWALLALVTAACGSHKISDLASIEQELGRLDLQAKDSGLPPADGNGYLQAAALLIQVLGLPGPGAVALERVPNLRHSAQAVALEAALLGARVAAAHGQTEAALEGFQVLDCARPGAAALLGARVAAAHGQTEAALEGVRATVRGAVGQDTRGLQLVGQVQLAVSVRVGVRVGDDSVCLSCRQQSWPDGAPRLSLQQPFVPTQHITAVGRPPRRGHRCIPGSSRHLRGSPSQGPPQPGGHLHGPRPAAVRGRRLPHRTLRPPPRAATAWLAAALASLAMGDVAAADLALTEANLLDPTHPRVWGYLALTALRAGRPDECREALKWADKAGLCDADCILQLAQGYKDAGLPHAREEQAMLMRLLPPPGGVETEAAGGAVVGAWQAGEPGPRGLREVGARLGLARSYMASQEWADAEAQMTAARVLAVGLRGVAEAGALDLLCRELEEVEDMHMG